METARIAQILDEMGTLLEIYGARTRSGVAPTTPRPRRSTNLPGDLSEMIADGRLKEVPGIGDTMHAKIVQLATTGQLPSYDELRRSTPPGLVALLRIPGLGPKKIKALHETLKIESLADLRAAGESGQIAKLKGFGAKTEAKILEGIAFVEKSGERILQSHALRLVAPILAAVRGHPQVIRAESAAACAAGPRRSAISTSCSARSSRPRCSTRSSSCPRWRRCWRTARPRRASGWPTACSATCAGSRTASSRSPSIISPGRRPTTSRCGSERWRAGLSLNEYALAGEDRSIACQTEAELFAALGLAEIPPELREDTGEIEAAENGPASRPGRARRPDRHVPLPHRLERRVGHARRDGRRPRATGACSTWGSPITRARPAMPAGLSIERVRAQWAEIDALNETFGGKFHLFKGTECDILADGSLDYPDDLLDGFDYVVASIHSSFQPAARGDDAAAGPGGVEPAGHDARPSDRPAAAGPRRLRRGPRRGHRRGRRRPAR